MLDIKPEIWTKNGGEQFVVLSLRDFEKLQELVEDAGLSRILREARRRNANSPTFSAAEVKRRLGLTKPRKGNAEDARVLREAKRRGADAPTTSHREMKRLHGMTPRKKAS